MKESFEKELNLLIVSTFHNILKTELKMINNITKSGLSMREVHLLEIVGASNHTMTISKIAKSFDITLASVTVMVNKLVELGYITKQKCTKDARTVYLNLTKKGRKIDTEHENFHKKMIAKISKNLNASEKQVMLQGVKALNEMFTKEFEAM